MNLEYSFVTAIWSAKQSSRWSFIQFVPECRSPRSMIRSAAPSVSGETSGFIDESGRGHEAVELSPPLLPSASDRTRPASSPSAANAPSSLPDGVVDDDPAVAVGRPTGSAARYPATERAANPVPARARRTRLRLRPPPPPPVTGGLRSLTTSSSEEEEAASDSTDEFGEGGGVSSYSRARPRDDDRSMV